MKKLLLILLCLPIIGFGQVKKNKSVFNFQKTNNYKKFNSYEFPYSYENKLWREYLLKNNLSYEQGESMWSFAKELPRYTVPERGELVKETKEKIYNFKTGEKYKDFNSIPVGVIYVIGKDKCIKIARDGYRYIETINSSVIECVEFDSLEWNGWSPRKGVKYKGELFTGTACGYVYRLKDQGLETIVEPMNYIEGKMNGYFCEYYKNGNKAVEAYFENGNPMKGKPYTMWKEDGTLLYTGNIENKLWKDPQCNKKHIIDGSSWEGILKGGSECKCNLIDLWSSQYHKDTTTVVWKHYKKQ